jgi:para-aminobenzoate synthetase component 1
VLRSKGRTIEVIDTDGGWMEEGDPFLRLRGLLRRYRVSHQQGLPPFQGGAAGYFSYELGRHVESLPGQVRDDFELPEMYLGLYDWVLAYDHRLERGWLIATGLPEGNESRAGERLAWVKERMRAGDRDLRPHISLNQAPVALRSNFSRKGYLSAIERAKEYIAAGDIYQVNLSQRFELSLEEQPWEVYRRMRQVSPVPYGAFLGFGEVDVISASMEQFLRVEDGTVETRPIKGTRPRGATPGEDAALADELLNSVKDRAENVMIVDLLRNDLGRVCRTGSIRVPQLFALERYAKVFHLVSTVVGELAPQHDCVDLLRTCFPGGSVTGCPKVRAMEIIDELEPTERSVYCGSIGYLGFSGTMDTSIVIRTIIATKGRACFQVGGAVVADSDPAAEYQETLDKARSSMAALGVALE